MEISLPWKIETYLTIDDKQRTFRYHGKWRHNLYNDGDHFIQFIQPWISRYHRNWRAIYTTINDGDLIAIGTGDRFIQR